MKFEGFIAKINEKSGTGKRGPWTLYTVKVEKPDGTEYAEWVNFGFDKPPFKDGDYVTFEAEADDKGVTRFTKQTLRLPKNGPARKAKQAKSSGGSGGGGGSRGGRTPFDGTGIQNRTHPETERRMGLSHAQDVATKVVELLLSANALPLTKATTKAGEAARFEEITAAIDKLTVRFYNDVSTGRVLTKVADEDGTTAKSPDPLPDQEPEGDQPDAEEPEGDEPEADDDAPIY